jgi:hypothetical protein
MDLLTREDLPFSQSLPEFQRFLPDDAACARRAKKLIRPTHHHAASR